MIRESTRRYVEKNFTLYDSIGACASAASKLFQERNWRWSSCGVPDESRILRFLSSLQNDTGFCASGRLVYFDGRFGHERIYIFNRKTFDPVNNYDEKIALSHLRVHGSRRLISYLSGREGRSSAMQNLQMDTSGFFADFGAGDSADCLIAKNLGYAVEGFDLFPTSGSHRPALTIADIAEHIPLPDESVDLAVCQAMIDLIEPEARINFYKEAYRVMKTGGQLSILFQSLKRGWGFSSIEEMDKMRTAGFKRLRSYPNGYVVTK